MIVKMQQFIGILNKLDHFQVLKGYLSTMKRPILYSSSQKMNHSKFELIFYRQMGFAFLQF